MHKAERRGLATKVPAAAKSTMIASATVVPGNVVRFNPQDIAVAAAFYNTCRPNSGPYVHFDRDDYGTVKPMQDGTGLFQQLYLRESRIAALWLAVQGSPAEAYPAHLWDLLTEMMTIEMTTYRDDITSERWQAFLRLSDIPADVTHAIIEEWLSRPKPNLLQ